MLHVFPQQERLSTFWILKIMSLSILKGFFFDKKYDENQKNELFHVYAELPTDRVVPVNVFK